MKQFYLLIFFMVSIGLAAQQIPVESQLPDAALRIHPNPAFGRTVQIVTASDGPKTILVYDLFGKAVLQRRLTDNTLNIETLVPGVYMVRVLQRGRSATKKLVVR